MTNSVTLSANSSGDSRCFPTVENLERRLGPNGRPGYLRVDTVHQGDTESTREYITSMPSMRSRNGRLRRRLSASRRSIWSPC